MRGKAHIFALIIATLLASCVASKPPSTSSTQPSILLDTKPPTPTPATAATPKPRRPDRWASPTPEAVYVAQAQYLMPDAQTVDLLESLPAPDPLLHVDSRHIALLHREKLLALERLARPSVGLAGMRIDPANATLVGRSFITRIEIFSLDDPASRQELVPPDDALFGDVRFSPDGTHLAVSVVRSKRVDVGIFELADASFRELTQAGPLNTIWGSPCSWTNNERLLCRRHGGQGEPPHVDVGPNVQELVSGAAPVLTYSNLLRDPNDDALFLHHAAVELVFVDLAGDVSNALVPPGIISNHALSPDGAYLVAERLLPPFPRVVPAEMFPRDVDIYEVATGTRVRQLQVAGTQSVRTRGIADGARFFRWDPEASAKLTFIERQTATNGTRLDVVRELEKPFDRLPITLPGRFSDVQWFEYTDDGTALLADHNQFGRRRLFRLDSMPELVAEFDQRSNDGKLERLSRTNGPRGAILEHRGRIYFEREHEGATRRKTPALVELELDSGKMKNIFTSHSERHETVIGILNARRNEFLLSQQSPASAPSLVLVHDDDRSAVTDPPEIPIALQGVTRRWIEYTRADGVKLSATLYLPASWQEGQRLPVVFWIYPREFSNEEDAANASEEDYRFFDVHGVSRFMFLHHGYALLDSPSIPIIGSRQSAQSDYVQQLEASAKAAVDYLDANGIADRKRIAVVGHSYGAFAVANLMAHSDLFCTAIALNGAYNRTLTPFGFQNEARTFWQRQEAYVDMSPFFFADKVKKPILLIHGEQDDNPGTPVMQSERFFAALAGNGIPSRYVSLPFEGHQYRARESVLHIAAEMLTWLDRHVVGAVK